MQLDVGSVDGERLCSNKAFILSYDGEHMSHVSMLRSGESNATTLPAHYSLHILPFNSS